MEPPKMEGNLPGITTICIVNVIKPQQYNDLLYIKNLKKTDKDISLAGVVEVTHLSEWREAIELAEDKWHEITLGSHQLWVAVVTNHDSFKALCEEHGIDGTRRHINPPFLLMAAKRNDRTGLKSTHRLMEDIQILAHNGPHKPNMSNYHHTSSWTEHTDNGGYYHIRTNLLTAQSVIIMVKKIVLNWALGYHKVRRISLSRLI